MLQSLRAKLIVSYALVVMLCLLLAGSAAAYLVNAHQQQIARRHMQILSASLNGQLHVMTQRQVPLPEILRRVEQIGRELQVRVLILDEEGHVLLDSEKQLFRNTAIPIDLPAENSPLRRTPIKRIRVPGTGQPFYVTASRLPQNPEASPNSPHFVALAVPAGAAGGAWRDLAPSLLVIGFAVFVIATLLGVVLARSVSLPIQQMTQATEAMARGDYAQEIKIRGNDEVARLARSFNTMAQEVYRAHRMQRDFVANVSHDLKTPLTSIQGFAQALLDGTANDPEAQRRAAEIIYEETERMRRLVQTLLELAKLESGQIKFKQEPVDLGPLLRECVDRSALMAESRAVTIHLHVPPSLPPVRGDRDRLAQVFNNLLDNAVTHTPADGTVEVSAALTSERTLEVVVTDTGEGISATDLPRIFERFYQTDKARTGRRGTGIGLAIVQEIVTAHGGRVTAASQPGQGSRFTVSLPLATDSGP